MEVGQEYETTKFTIRKILMKHIAVMTSGGDAPGMNACLRAVVRAAHNKKVKVFGILNGYEGLIDNQIQRLTPREVGNIIQKGGSILKTSRSKRFLFSNKTSPVTSYPFFPDKMLDSVLFPDPFGPMIA